MLLHLALTVTLCFPLLSLSHVTGLVPNKVNIIIYINTNICCIHVSNVVLI